MTEGTQWRVLYKNAMLELNQAEMQRVINSARAAVDQRIQELRTGENQDNANIEETRDLLDALQSLRTLERVECGVPSIGSLKSALQERAS